MNKREEFNFIDYPSAFRFQKNIMHQKDVIKATIKKLYNIHTGDWNFVVEVVYNE